MYFPTFELYIYICITAWLKKKYMYAMYVEEYAGTEEDLDCTKWNMCCYDVVIVIINIQSHL